MNNEDVFNGFGVVIELSDPNNFLKIIETLSRIGIAAKSENILYQSCHILHRRGHYAIMHFKEMMALDGKEVDLSEQDQKRTVRIARLLEEWNLLKVVDDRSIEPSTMAGIRVIRYGDKDQWQLVPKYTMRSFRNPR